MTDEDTVIQKNMDIDTEQEWKTVNNKRGSKKLERRMVTIEKKQTKESNNHTVPKQIKLTLKNPYKIAQHQKLSDEIKSTRTTAKTSLASYMEAAKEKQRVPNKHSIRLTTSFTPRLSGAGEFKRVARELLAYAREFAPEAMLLPWDDHSGLGPINKDDLANPRNMTDTIKHYFDKPAYVIIQPGNPAYGIGIRFSVNSPKYEFINKWNIRKREYKLNNRAAYTISLAPMQNSPSAYIIGIAVGSTENQDIELLNQKLERESGIKGIEMSYQNIHQSGITPEF